MKPGYEPIRDCFESHFANNVNQCAQVCVFVRGEKVADLWGALRDPAADAPQHGYGPGSLQNVFSSSKALTSLVVAMLVDRGHLRYDQLVTDLWPEYGQNGKGSTTIAMVMRHEAGLPAFKKPIDVLELTADRVRAGSVSDLIASKKLSFPPGEQRAYHFITRGWIVNEIVRRADPQGRTVGEFLRDEVATPLGFAEELFFGLPAEMHSRVAPLVERGLFGDARQYFLPRALGGGETPGAQWLRTRMASLGLAAGASTAKLVAQLLGRRVPMPIVVGDEDDASNREIAMHASTMFNHPRVRQCEIPSGNAHASARAMAAVAAAIVEGGALPGGPRLLSEQGCVQGHGDPDTKRMLGMDFTFTNAGWCTFKKMRSGFVGWMGLGGSVLQWHPEARVGFGYAMNLLEPLLSTGQRGLELQRVALQCASAEAAKQGEAWASPSHPHSRL